MSQSNTMLERAIYNKAGRFVDDVVYPQNIYRRYFRHVTTGSVEVNVNGSVTPQLFEVRPQQHVHIYEVNGYVITNTDLPQPDYWGNVPLTNGFTMQVIGRDGATLIDLFDGVPLKNSAQVGIFGNPVVQAETTKKISGVSITSFIVTPEKSMHLESNEAIQFTVRDDLTALQEFRIMALGVIPKEDI